MKNLKREDVCMKKFFCWLKDEESGQGMVEYGLIIALVAIVVIATLAVLGPRIAGMFTRVSDSLPSSSTAVSSVG